MTQTKKKILIVDDEPEFAKLLKLRLTSLGYEVDIANDGQQGLSKAVSKPDLVLLDVMMPNLGGIELSKILKENKDTEHIPIVFLTAKDDEATRIDGIRSGAEYFLTKPFETQKLIDVIQGLIGN